MAEYIEREAVLPAIENAVELYPSEYDEIKSHIKAIPAANVAPVVHGEWITIEKWAAKAQYKCSVCGRRIMASLDVAKVMGKYPYCNCGAKMEGRDDGI